MNRRFCNVSTIRIGMILSAVLALSATAAAGTKIQDLVRLKGEAPIQLQGLGLIIGLDGTGDSGVIAGRPIARLLEESGNPIGDLSELDDADSYALVMISAEIPATGGRDGDRITVNVDTLLDASSLAGGRLITSPLRLPIGGQLNQSPRAFAMGEVVIEGENPRAGVIRDGGQLLQSFPSNVHGQGNTIMLVLHDESAGWPAATALAQTINSDPALSVYQDIAQVVDQKTIRVIIPPEDQHNPAGFITNVLTLPIDPLLLNTEAKVIINRREGIIVVTGNVEIDPVSVSARGLTFTTVTPTPRPTADEPMIEERSWVGLDTTSGSSQRSANLNDLVNALKQLRVSTDDQIAIILELHQAGALHGRIVNQ